MSAIVLATSAKDNLTTVLFQFGLGLLATGYAVLARIHLTSASKLVEEANPEAVIGQIVQRSRELAINIETATLRFDEFANALMRRSSDAADASRSISEEAILRATTGFEKLILGAMAQSRDAIIEIRGLVADTSFTSQRVELANSIKVTIENVTQLNAILEHFSPSAHVGASATQEVTTSAIQLRDSLRHLNTEVDSLGGEQGTFTRASNSLKSATEIVCAGPPPSRQQSRGCQKSPR